MKHFLTHSNNPERSAVIWNMIASISMAIQSVILLIVISNTPGLDDVDVGIFTMGNTLNNLFLCIGRYGVRGFQVSDVKKEFDFKTYKKARIISVIAMALISVVYVIFLKYTNEYTNEKTIIIVLMCIYKIPEAYEDVYFGEYHRNNRLDVASKALAVRYIISVLLWSLLIVLTKNMIISVLFTTIVTFIIMFWFICLTKEYLNVDKLSLVNDCMDEKQENKKNGTLFSLFIVTSPLALSQFLAIYIGSAPRISIDKHMDDISQGIYGYISMPIFVVQLFVTFILYPLMYKLSQYWDNNRNEYKKETFRLFFITLVISIICLLGTWIIGVPVLSTVYSRDLKLYKTELMFLMIGSCFLAISTLLQTLLTIMRKQKMIMLGYALASVFVFVLSDVFVSTKGIRGAVESYIFALIVLCIVYYIGYISALKYPEDNKG